MGATSAVVSPVAGATAMPRGQAEMQSESTPGQAPELAHLAVVVGLVWRSVVMWMVLLALLTLARLLG
jgi:adenosylcobinamide-phosphate synthase